MATTGSRFADSLVVCGGVGGGGGRTIKTNNIKRHQEQDSVEGTTLHAMLNVVGFEEVVLDASASAEPSRKIDQGTGTTTISSGMRRESTEIWDGRQGRDYVCPTCGKNFESGQFWIQCDMCKVWYHGDCVYVKEYEANQVSEFHCVPCEREYGPSIFKPVTNKHRHDRSEENADSKPVQSGTEEFIRQLQARQFECLDKAEGGKYLSTMRGHALTMPTLISKGFGVPILIASKEGLEMEVPCEGDLTVDQVMKRVGPNYELDVIDVARQISVKMPMVNFVRCVGQDKKNRESIFNCISLEVSKTPLGQLIKAPAIVNRLSWVEKCWPRDSELKPAVNKYCLMSMGNSFTDFHIDFGGTSVWYHIVKGEKIFYFIRPTSDNLIAYERWMKMKNQSEKFFGDMADACYTLVLRPGQTLLIPTGWIHAVLTPSDSVVFGGNFLHSLNIRLQLTIKDMETRIQTPTKFQFPFFELAHWYATPSFTKLLEDNLADKVPPRYLVEGAVSLVEALKHWLNKSNSEKTPKSGSISTYAPLGLNCRKIIKDLNKALKRAEKLLDGQPVKRKSYKTFDATSSSKKSMKREVVSSRNLKNDGHGEVAAGGMVGGSDPDDAESSELVVDETSCSSKSKLAKLRLQATKRTERLQSSDSETKGVIKMKLSLCGKSGLPEVTEATLTPPVSIAGPPPEDTVQGIDVGSAGGAAVKTKTCSSALQGQKVQSNWNAKHEKASAKRKKITTSDEDLEEQDIIDMIKGRPEDGEFIYLDVETGVDEEDDKSKNGRGGAGRSKQVARDEAWTPRAKVVIRGTPKAARPTRENAKREVVETSIANAAAKLEHIQRVKRPYNRKKPRKSNAIGASSTASNETTAADVETSNTLPLDTTTASNVVEVAPSSVTGSMKHVAAGTTLGPSGNGGSMHQSEAATKAKKPSKPRKGLMTPKQRLARAMKIRPKF